MAKNRNDTVGIKRLLGNEIASCMGQNVMF